jgi:subtilisin family serine protease
VLEGAGRFMVVMAEQADVSGAYLLPAKVDKTRHVYEQLRATAARSQAPVIEALRAQGYTVRPFLISNELLVERPAGAKSTTPEPAAVIAQLLDRADVAGVVPVGTAYPIGVIAPEAFPSAQAVLAAAETGAITPGSNIGEIGAQRLHRLGIDGRGIVVGILDSGAQFDHEALAESYRGRDGDHNYHWFDPSDDPRPFPSEINGHGSHTTGTIAGRAPGFDIGVAPGAEWIHCRGLGPGASRATILSCLEFFLAPTDLNGENPRPELAPDVTNHSYICPFCALETAFDNLRAAGIMAVVGAGNQGPGCGTVFDPASYAEVLTVGASTGGRRSQIAEFSSRGFGDGRIKPELIAPGVDILSSGFADNYFRLSGTSFAAPQVAGVVALLWSHRPELRGEVEATRAHLHATAFQRVGNGSCENDQAIPNEVFGFGFLDAYAAVCGEDDCRAQRLDPAAGG